MLALAALSFVIATGPKLTFECQATRLKTVLQELSPKVSEHLEASPDLGQEFVVMSFHDAAPKEFEARLAQAMCGRWLRFDGGLRLMPDPAAKQALADRASAGELPLLQRLWKAERKKLEAEPDFGRAQAIALLGTMRQVDEAYAARDKGEGDKNVGALLENTPGQRLARRIMLEIDPARLCGLKSKAVFSDQPTRLQKALGNVAPIIEAAAKEQAAWLAEYPGDAGFNARGWWFGGDPRGYRKPIDPKDARGFVRYVPMQYLWSTWLTTRGQSSSAGTSRLPAPGEMRTTNRTRTIEPKSTLRMRSWRRCSPSRCGAKKGR